MFNIERFDSRGGTSTLVLSNVELPQILDTAQHNFQLLRQHDSLLGDIVHDALTQTVPARVRMKNDRRIGLTFRDAREQFSHVR